MASLGTALVTGASQGIGRAIAVRLARDGFDIALNDLHFNKQKIEAVRAEISRSGRKSSFVPANVKYDQEVKNMVDQTVADFGTLDVMVANAGIGSASRLVDTAVEDWDEVLAVNARGVFLCFKYAGRQMITQGRGGRMIAASSLLGKQGWPLVSAYSASKFAVRGLTHTAAREFAPYGITVNAYAPGGISTDMINNIDTATLDAVGLSPDAVPLKRHGTPEEVANLVSFLVSKDASYITGQSVSINGGIFGD